MLRLRLPLLVVLVALLAACGGSAPSSGAAASGEAPPLHPAHPSPRRIRPRATIPAPPRTRRRVAELSEGAYCLADASGCTPSDADLGGAALGPFDGTLYETADGYAIVVDAGKNPGWSMTTTGVTLEATVKLGAALATVEP